jgi:hypothetical protein
VCAAATGMGNRCAVRTHTCVTLREQQVMSRRGACAPLLVCWTCFCTPGMSAGSRYFPGFGLLLCPGGTPGAELEHAPASLFPVHLSPLGAVHASALGAVAPTNTAAPRTTPRMRFFITLPFLASWARPFDLPATCVLARRRTKQGRATGVGRVAYTSRHSAWWFA